MLEGLKLDFIRFPELSQECPPTVVTGHLQSSRLEEFIEPWLKAGIIGKGKVGEEGFFSRLFTVPKDENKWRPIIDLSSLTSWAPPRNCFRPPEGTCIHQVPGVRPGNGDATRPPLTSFLCQGRGSTGSDYCKQVIYTWIPLWRHLAASVAIFTTAIHGKNARSSGKIAKK